MGRKKLNTVKSPAQAEDTVKIYSLTPPSVSPVTKYFCKNG